MARQMIVVLALIFVAIFGVASAAEAPAESPTGSKGDHASAPAGDKSAADTPTSSSPSTNPTEGALSPSEGSTSTPAAADTPASSSPPTPSAEGASSPTEGSASPPAADGPVDNTADGAASGPAAPAPAPNASGKTTAFSMGFSAVIGFAAVAAGYFF